MRLILMVTAAMVSVTAAYLRPHYIAVPADQIQFLDLSNLQSQTRNTRQAALPLYPPIFEPRYAPQRQSYYRPVEEEIRDPVEAASDGRPARHANRGNNDYTDFGAHTGNNGAFGWFSDYPVYARE